MALINLPLSVGQNESTEIKCCELEISFSMTTQRREIHVLSTIVHCRRQFYSEHKEKKHCLAIGRIQRFEFALFFAIQLKMQFPLCFFSESIDLLINHIIPIL